ncbi:hypothetical protein [Bradyrhizobium sp. USDA 4502]
MSKADEGLDDIPAYRALERTYHSYLTGLILMISSRAGASSAADVVFHMFRRHQQANFLPALKKLGLENLPHAVASAQYLYIVNRLGGVNVEYVYENDQKAWIRYPPPRWIWWGTAICGIPSEISRAMVAGWHGNNGPALGNPRLGFVCTGQTVDGQPGLEGYFKEYDRDLLPSELLVFSPGERCPRFRIEDAPKVPESRLSEGKRQKSLRNYAGTYINAIVPIMTERLGPEAGGHYAKAAARLTGMHVYDEVAALLGGIEPGPLGFAKAFARLAAGQGDDAVLEIQGSTAYVRHTSWRLMTGREHLSPSVFDALNELWVGLALAHDRFTHFDVIERRDRGEAYWAWRIS